MHWKPRLHAFKETGYANCESRFYTVCSRWVDPSHQPFMSLRYSRADTIHRPRVRVIVITGIAKDEGHVILLYREKDSWTSAVCGERSKNAAAGEQFRWTRACRGPDQGHSNYLQLKNVGNRRRSSDMILLLITGVVVLCR